MTPGVGQVLDSVSAAIRDACGWHVSPPLPVVERTQGPGRMLALRSLMVTGVESVAECGAELAEGQYEWRMDGALRRACWRSWPDAYRSVEVRYTSGIPSEMAPALAAVASQLASNALAAPAGVRSDVGPETSVTPAPRLAAAAAMA